MCTVTLDFSRIRKEVTNGLLDLIEWTDDGRKDKLRIYSLTAKEWRTIARKLGLEDETPGFISGLARRHRDDDGECVREVFGKWLENAVGLPNASLYPKTWEGLCTLLDASNLGEVSKKIRKALDAADSSVWMK